MNPDILPSFDCSQELLERVLAEMLSMVSLDEDTQCTSCLKTDLLSNCTGIYVIDKQQ